MGSKVSQPVRILALVGLLGALALGAGFALLGKSSGSEAVPATIKPLHPRHKAAAFPAGSKPAVATTHAKPAARAAAKPVEAHRTKAAAKATATPKAKTPTKPKPAPVRLPANGLPDVVNRALLSHEVVVVSLYDPQAVVDAASLGEAQAGAKLANVGFVPLNVLSQAQAEPLAFRRPGDLVFRVNGFADRDTVAQAAANARP
jgi:hypothetical protein